MPEMEVATVGQEANCRGQLQPKTYPEGDPQLKDEPNVQ